MNKPPGYENDLSSYGPVVIDVACDEPVSWGFRILRHLGEPRFSALTEFGWLECLNPMHPYWVLITKKLTREEAEAKYGAVTNVERGPRGGFRSVTYGTTRFFRKELAPPTDSTPGDKW